MENVFQYCTNTKSSLTEEENIIRIEELKNMGYDKMLIGCLIGNPSNEFYKHMGGKLIKTRMFEKLQLLENVYYLKKYKKRK